MLTAKDHIGDTSIVGKSFDCHGNLTSLEDEE